VDFFSETSCDAPDVPAWLFVAVAVAAFASGAPLSGEAHQTAAEVLGVEHAASSRLFAAAHLAAAVALAAAGISARRQTPVLSTIFGLVGAEVFHLLSAAVRSSALTVGVGVLATAAMLTSIRVAPRTVGQRAPLREAILGSATLSLAGVPGASPLACALASRAWTASRAPIEAAALVAAPFELRAAWSAWASTDAVASGTELALALAVAFVAALLGSRGLRLGAERLVGLSVPWLCVLGASLLAYAWSAR
jgi:hypothetical protein